MSAKIRALNCIYRGHISTDVAERLHALDSTWSLQSRVWTPFWIWFPETRLCGKPFLIAVELHIPFPFCRNLMRQKEALMTLPFWLHFAFFPSNTVQKFIYKWTNIKLGNCNPWYVCYFMKVACHITWATLKSMFLKNSEHRTDSTIFQ